MTAIIITLSALLLLLALGNWALEHVFADPALRLAIDIENESKLMRRNHETRHTFEYRPKHIEANHDYRVELHGPEHAGLDEPILRVAEVKDPEPSSTCYHRHFVSVPHDLMAVHHAEEPTRITLEERDGEIVVAELV